MNTDYGSPNNPATKELKHTTTHFNLEQHIKDPTRQTRNTSTTLDLIFTQMTHVRESGVMDINISDHQPVYIIKKKTTLKTQKTTYWGRTYKNYSTRQLVASLEETDTTHILQNTDPQSCWEDLHNLIKYTADKLCPQTKHRIPSNTTPWLSKELPQKKTGKHTTQIKSHKKQSKQSNHPGQIRIHKRGVEQKPKQP